MRAHGDTGNGHFESQSPLAGTQKGSRCNNERPPGSQNSSRCKGSSTLRGSGFLLPTDHQSKHFSPIAMSHLQQASILTSLRLLCLSLLLLLFLLLSAMPSFLATQTVHFSVLGRGSKSYAWIRILVPPFTNCMTLAISLHIFNT